MNSRVSWNPGAILAPVPPTLVSCGSMDAPNLLTVAWTGILSTKPPKTYISVRPERYSYPLIKESGVFTINLPPASLVKAVDFCGVKSGRDTNKLTQTGLTAIPGAAIAAPSIAQCPINIECRVCSVTELGSHHMFLADIVNVRVDDRFISPSGKLLIERCGLLAYAHGSYFSLGEPLGTFGFSVRKKAVPTKPHRKHSKRPKAKPKQ